MTSNANMLIVELHYVDPVIAHTKFCYLLIMCGDFLGSFCNCLLPENIQVSAVGHVPERLSFPGKI